ncbi:two-component system regulatory protein YycI [Nocardia sp. X0981]
MGKAEDAVGLIEKHYHAGTWDSVGFQDGQAKEALDALAALSAEEFEQAFNDLDFTHSQSYKYDVREQLVHDAGDLKDDPKYRDIIKALETDDPGPVVQAKREKEEAKFGDYGYERRDEKEHLHWVDLYQPKGASPTLIALIEDTEFSMQWGLDTLGARNPEAAPDFTNLLDGDQITDPEGWAKLIKEHDEVKKQLSDRQEEESSELTGVKVNTEDSAVLNSETFKKLVRIKDDLNKELSKDITGGLENFRRAGDKFVYDSGPSDKTYTFYEKNSESGEFILDPTAEQIFYVAAIDKAAEDWEKEYADAIEKFQKKANDIDKPGNGNDGNGNDGNGNNGNGNNGNGNNGNGNNGNGGGDAQFNGGNNNDDKPQDTDKPADADKALDDMDKELSDILGGPTGTGTPGDETDPTGGTENEDPSGIKDQLMDYVKGDTGNGATATQAQQPQLPQQQATGGGFDPTSALAMPLMASALAGQAGNAFGGNEKEKKKDDRDEDDRRDGDRQAPGPGQQSPGTAVTPDSGAAPQNVVTASTDAGPPPIVNTPGMNTDHKLPGEEKTIKMPQTVSDALTRQQSNPAINATTAYAETSAAQDADSPWREIDVSELRVGDVIKWENHSAVLFQKDGGWHYVIGDQVTPLDTQNLDSAQFGKFERFLHPTGLDSATTNAPAPEPSKLPEPKVSQTAPADPPAVQPPREV